MNLKLYYQSFALLNRLERETGINECTFQGIYFWRLVRFSVHRRLMAKLMNSFEGEPEFGSKSQHHKLSFWQQLQGFIFSPFFKFSHCENLIIEHPRKVSLGKSYVDPYTYYLTKELKKSKQSFRSLEKTAFAHLAGLGNKRLQYKGIDFTLYKSWRKLCDKLRRRDTRLPELVVNKLSRVEKGIFEATGITLKLEILVDGSIRKFRDTYSYFKIYLQRVKPKRLYLVVSYGLYAEIQVAKDLEIEVIEMQHGLVSNLHAGYSFPNWQSVPYAPDRILSFGDAWFENVHIPGVKIEAKGFSWLNNNSSHFQLREKKKNTIVVLSQWMVSAALCDWVIALSELLPEFEIYYKIHPQEDPLVALKALRNVTNVAVGSEDLYTCLASKQWAIGVSSTALFEAIAFNCSIAIADLLSAEQFEQIANMNNVPYCASPKQMAESIRREGSQNIDVSRWFHGSEHSKLTKL